MKRILEKLIMILVVVSFANLCFAAPGISEINGPTARYVADRLDEMKPHTTIAFKICKVVRTEDFWDGVQWRVFFETPSINGIVVQSSLRIYAGDSQVKILNADNPHTGRLDSVHQARVCGGERRLTVKRDCPCYKCCSDCYKQQDCGRVCASVKAGKPCND